MWDLLVLSETAEQYRLCAMIRPCLDEPAAFASQAQWLAMLETERRALVDAYYTFDARVMRELVGQRPTSKLRRQLEAQADRLNVTVPSCRRQFDNLQRLYEHDWEEGDRANGPGSTAGNTPSLTPTHAGACSPDGAVSTQLEAGRIPGAANAGPGSGGGGCGASAGRTPESRAGGEETAGRLSAEPGLVVQVSAAFLLPASLSSKYVRLLFLANHQFDASKRRLHQLTYSDWDAFASSLLLSWTSPQSGFELDSKMVKSLRAIKNWLADQRASAVLGWPMIQQAVLTALPAALGPDRPAGDVDQLVRGVASRMRPLLRGVVEICGSLSYPRELRDLFVSLADVADTLRAMGLSQLDATALLSCLTRCLPGFLPGVQRAAEEESEACEAEASRSERSGSRSGVLVATAAEAVEQQQDKPEPPPEKPSSGWQMLLAAFSLETGNEAAAEAGQADAWARFLDGATSIIVRLMVV
jgi:hypothetical protein